MPTLTPRSKTLRSRQASSEPCARPIRRGNKPPQRSTSGPPAASPVDGCRSIATASYAGILYHNIRNFDAQKFDGRTLINLSATWKSERNGLYVALFGKNVLDERYGQIGFDNTTIFGGQNVSYGKPASYGATVGLKF